MSKALELANKSREFCGKLRNTSMPLADLIPHLQATANEAEHQHDAMQDLQTECAALRVNEINLTAQVEALRKYAERYQRLRDSDHWPAVFNHHTAPEPIRGSELDEAIDAAMGEKA